MHQILLFSVLVLPMNKVRFKNIIKTIETRGGTNLNHPVIQSGVNEGQIAAGQYGIVPSSLKDFVAQSKNRNLPVDGQVEALSTEKDPMEITRKLNSNPELDEKAADLGADLMLTKTNGDEAKAAFLWNQGQNSRKIDLNNPYVQKFLKEQENLDVQEPVDRFSRLKQILGK